MLDAGGANFESIKILAIQAENKMLERTNGANTHRGTIFSLGLVCISVARLIREKIPLSRNNIHLKIIEDWRATLMNHHLEKTSHGQMVIRKYSVGGAKHMAMQGYKIIFDILDDFFQLLRETTCLNNSCLFAYTYFLKNIDDTNILYRKGHEGLEYAKRKAEDLLEINCLELRYRAGIALHELFSKENISPGGVGDLLGVLLFISQLFDEKLLCHY